MASKKIPVMFIHGMWLHGDSWREWAQVFKKAGYSNTMAPGWPGEYHTVEATRQHPENVAGYNINDITNHYAALIRRMDVFPIVIGHCFGGLIAQKLLGRGMASGAVAINPAQPKGIKALSLKQLRTTLPVIKNPANLTRAVMPTPQQFRKSYGNTLSQAESGELYDQWAIPSPARPLFSALTANLTSLSPMQVNVANTRRGPLLIIAGGRDRAAPVNVVRANYKMYWPSPAITDYKEFTDRGHTMTIDEKWPEIADYSLRWLKEQEL